MSERDGVYREIALNSLSLPLAVTNKIMKY